MQRVPRLLYRTHLQSSAHSHGRKSAGRSALKNSANVRLSGVSMVSEDDVRRTDEALSGMTEKDTRKLIRSFQKKQEPLLVYIAAVIEREGLNEEEQDL